MKKRILFSLFVFVLVTLSLFGACAEPAPTPTPEPAPTPEPTPAPEPAEPIKILYGTWAPPGDTWTIVAEEFGVALEERTGGRVKVELSVGGALGKPGEFMDLVQKGVCDMANIHIGATVGRFPITDLTALPWQYPSSTVATKAWMDVYAAGHLDKEYADVKVFTLCVFPPTPLFTVDKPVTTLEDIKGLKIRAAAPAIKQRVEMWGGVPVYIPLPESYSALQKGTVDGTITLWIITGTFKLYEVLNYATLPGAGDIGAPIIMNQQFYNNLPADIQKIVDDMYVEFSLRTAEIAENFDKEAKQAFLDKGGQMLEWEPAAWEQIKEMYGSLWDKYIADTEAMGLQPRPAIEAYKAALEKYGVSDPAVGYVP